MLELKFLSDIMQHGSIEPMDIELYSLEQEEPLQFDREIYAMKMRELEQEVLRVCKTKVWINPKLYNPTDREKPYIVGTIQEMEA